jgi:phage-related holin
MLAIYAPIEPEAAPMLPTYIILSIFAWFMTILLFFRWKERRMKAPLLLFITFLCYSILMSVMALGIGDALAVGYKRELYQFSLAFGYAGIMVANSILLLFSAEIFTIDLKYVKKYIIISLLIAVAVALPWNYYGVIDAEVNRAIYIRPYTSVAMAFFSVLTYSKIYSQAMRVYRLVDEKTAKWGFKLIAFSQICMILFFACMFADLIVFGLTDLKGYTIFAYLAWVFAGLFMFFSYLGLTMPQWLRKRLESA